MQLIGYMDSPFVRRVAVTAEFLGIPYEHRELSIFRDFEEFSAISPLVKVPTLVCDSGEVLVESTLIVDYLESLAGAGKTLLPQIGEDRVRALQIIGFALVANEKVAQNTKPNNDRSSCSIRHGSSDWSISFAVRLICCMLRLATVMPGFLNPAFLKPT